MAEKLVTMDAPADHSLESIESTGFAAENIARTLDAAYATEIEAFAAVRAPVGVSEYRIGVLAADIERHMLSLRQNIRIRTAEVQAELTLSDLEAIIGELLIARDVLLGVLGRSDLEPQQEARHLTDILDEILD